MSTKRKAEAAPLRRIAVHVEEPEPGWFAWVLTEASEGMSDWATIETADEWKGSYKEAMAAGLWQLQQMIEDLDVGPREGAPAAAAKPKKGNVFGFGFGTNLT